MSLSQQLCDAVFAFYTAICDVDPTDELALCEFVQSRTMLHVVVNEMHARHTELGEEITIKEVIQAVTYLDRQRRMYNQTIDDLAEIYAVCCSRMS
jgi:hypothetical protein